MTRLITISDAAETFSMSEEYLRKLAREGKIPAYRLGKTGEWRIDLDGMKELFGIKPDKPAEERRLPPEEIIKRIRKMAKAGRVPIHPAPDEALTR